MASSHKGSQKGPQIGRFMNSELYSDLKLVCQGQEFPVHKLVVCSQSPVLTAAVREPFEEAKTGVIRIEGFEAETVRLMVEFLYIGDYGTGPTDRDTQAILALGTKGVDNPFAAAAAAMDAAKPSGDLFQHVRVNSIADYYNITGLAKLATSKFERAVETHLNPELFLGATKEALAISGDRSMHEMMSRVVAKNAGRFLDLEPLEELVGEFGVQVLGSYRSMVDEREKKLNGRILELERYLLLEYDRCEKAEARADHIVENIRQSIQRMRGRHC